MHRMERRPQGNSYMLAEGTIQLFSVSAHAGSERQSKFSQSGTATHFCQSLCQ
jgi:hypothetical protein